MASSDETEYLKKSAHDPTLVDAILRQPNWEGGEYKPYELVLLTSGSPEYEEVAALFDETSRCEKIAKIERVENPFLLGQYLMKKEKMGREKPDDLKEKSFFHGTNRNNVDGICRHNFDWRRTGNACGSRFGRGVSFTPQVSYASYYTSDNTYFLVKVLVGNSTRGNSSTIIPPPPFDTTDNGKGTVYVKYEDDDFYPQYIITSSSLW